MTKPTWQDMRKYYNENIERYVNTHKGAFVLLTPADSGSINESFHTAKGIEKAVADYESSNTTPKPFYCQIPLMINIDLTPTEREKRLVQDIFDWEKHSLESGKDDIIGSAVR